MGAEVRTRWTWLGGVPIDAIEIVQDGDSLEVNVLPAQMEEPPAAAGPEPQAPGSPEPAQDVVAPPPVVDVPFLATAPSPKRRTLMGGIRAGWFVAFTAAGEALTYGLNNLTALHLPPGTATAVGAVGYGIKRAVWPDTTV